MKDKVKGVAAAVAAIAVLGVGGAAIASAAGGGDSSSQATQSAEPAENESDNEAPDQAISSGTALDKASAAALKHTGGGQVTETEVGDEESYYEVEVTRDDGSQVDVQLDRSFNVVGSSADEE
jgi:uncharacterized membrane protein YkoI